MEGIRNPWSPVWTDGCHPPPWSLSFRSQSRPAGAAAATLERVVCFGLLVASSEPPGPSQPQLLPGSSLHQLLFTIYLLGCYEMGDSPLIWEFWPSSSSWEGLGHSDHPGIHQARADPAPHPALLWTYSQGRLSAVGLSHGTAQQVPGQQRFCMIAPLVSFCNRSCGVTAVKQRCWSGYTVNLRTTGNSRDTWKKIICLFWHVFADLDSLLSPFLVFLLSLYYSTFQL